jgi:hypothetical protein
MSRPREKYCGTMAAVRRHYRRKEKLCPACKAAEKRDNTDRYAKKKHATANSRPN